MPGKPLYIVTYYYKDEGFYTGDYFGPTTLERCKDHVFDVFDQFYNVESVRFYEIREIDLTKAYHQTQGEDDIHE